MIIPFNLLFFKLLFKKTEKSRSCVLSLCHFALKGIDSFCFLFFNTSKFEKKQHLWKKVAEKMIDIVKFQKKWCDGKMTSDKKNQLCFWGVTLLGDVLPHLLWSVEEKCKFWQLQSMILGCVCVCVLFMNWIAGYSATWTWTAGLLLSWSHWSLGHVFFVCVCLCHFKCRPFISAHH